MLTLVRREFIVDVPLQTAWRHLALVEQWPTWAKHIRRVDLHPPGNINAESTGLFHLGNDVKSAFRMSEFNLHQNWKWVGSFLWLTVHYDHLFEELSPQQTKLTWVIECEGFTASVLGRLFALVYNRNLDKAVPLLIDEMHASRSGI